MLHQPTAHLAGHDRLAGYRQFLSPATIHPHPKAAACHKGKLDQLDFKRGPAHMVLQEHAVKCFGTRHDPFYLCNTLLANQIFVSTVRAKLSSRAYRPRPNCS